MARPDDHPEQANSEPEEEVRRWVRDTLRRALLDTTTPKPGTGPSAIGGEGDALRTRILARTGMTGEDYAKTLGRLMTELIRELKDSGERKKFLDTLTQTLLEDILNEMRTQRLARSHDAKSKGT